MISVILAVGLVLVAGSLAVKGQTDWAIMELGENIDRLVIIVVLLAVAPFMRIASKPPRADEPRSASMSFRGY